MLVRSYQNTKASNAAKADATLGTKSKDSFIIAADVSVGEGDAPEFVPEWGRVGADPLGPRAVDAPFPPADIGEVVDG